MSETAARAARGEAGAERATARVGRGQDWPWILGLILVVAVVFFPLTFLGKVFSSPDAQAPQGSASMPRPSARAPKYPLWNPFIFAGIPSYAPHL